MSEKFVHLHCHSCYSLGAGASDLPTLFEAAKGSGMPALAITDTNGMYGAVSAQRVADDVGVKPLIGAVVDEPDPVAWPSSRYAVLLARDADGYAEIARTVTARRMAPDDFSLPAFAATMSDHVILLSPDPATLEAIRLHGDGANRYVELVDHGDSGSYRRIQTLLKLARRLDLPTVATNAVHFAETSGYETHRLLAAIRTNTTLNTPPPGAVFPKEAWLKPPPLMASLFRNLPDALARTVEIADSCDFRFDIGATRFPPYPTPDGEPSHERLARLARAGLIVRYGEPTDEARRRVEYELDMIHTLGFDEYFLIVRDIVNEARRLEIPTIGRGSAANSLVLYALGVTDVCPLKLNLYFERFLNPGRTDKPDIDIDFPWNRREEILRFIYERFGEDHVAMIGAHVTYRGRGAVREVGKAFGLSDTQLSRFTKRLPGWFNISQLDEAIDNLPECRGLPVDEEPWASILPLAKRIEGFPRVLSTHCSGIVVSPQPVTDFTPLERSGRGLAITQLDMYGIEDIGLVKIDILGQRALAVVADVRKEVREKYGVEIDWTKIEPENDEATRRRMRKGETLGCFYIESPAMRSLLVKLKCDDFETLVAASSIIRPGVAESGMMKEFIERHFNRRERVYLHPAMRTILSDTYGVMVYQEDVIKVAHVVAGMSLAEADKLRRLMNWGKKRPGEAMALHRERFIAGTVANGATAEVADEIWRQIESFGGYAFCKAHSASFAVVSWRTAYLKEHYPAEFMAAVIANHGGFYGTSAYIEEARRMEVAILPPDVNKSGKECVAETSGAIRIGLGHVKGLSERSIDSIIAHRPYQSLGDFLSRSGCGKVEAETLAMVGAFDAFGYPRPSILMAVAGKKVERSPMPWLIDEAVELPRTNPYSFEELLTYERELLGLTVWAHPLAIWRKAIPTDRIMGRDLPRHVGQRVTLVGWLIHAQRTSTNKGEQMKFLTMEDETAMFEVTLFPRAYRKTGHALAGAHRGPFIVEGTVENDDGFIAVNGERLFDLCGRPERRAYPSLTVQATAMVR